jgi:hypothetical protein
MLRVQPRENLRSKAIFVLLAASNYFFLGRVLEVCGVLEVT